MRAALAVLDDSPWDADAINPRTLLDQLMVAGDFEGTRLAAWGR